MQKHKNEPRSKFTGSYKKKRVPASTHEFSTAPAILKFSASFLLYTSVLTQSKSVQINHGWHHLLSVKL